MKTTLITILAATSILGTAAAADTVQANASAVASADASFEVAQNRTYLDVLAELEMEGYTINQLTTTWLGRMKITAQSAANLREVVVSQTTGEIMSDVILQVFANGNAGLDSGQTGTGTNADSGISTNVGAGINLEVGGAGASTGGGISLGIGN
ncbi:MAG: hypothetical protein Q8Q26_12785 [Pseudorhodobacter sp.]|nr:hypothetical protein [Pseudorhodobacter sp.]